MPTAIKGCYSCDIRVTEACEAAYHEQCPPCAKLAVENGNSLQQLKAKIATIADSVEDYTTTGADAGTIACIVRDLRQLSAV